MKDRTFLMKHSIYSHQRERSGTSRAVMLYGEQQQSFSVAGTFP